jgi:hypothetical protein
MNAPLPDPSPSRIYRLEATLGEPLDLGDLAQGRRRIVPLTGGTFTGPELNGRLLPGSSADWQLVLPDGTAVGDIRYTLQTTAALCSTSNHAACVTAAPKCSNVSPAARTLTRANTPSAPQPRSRPPRPRSIG